MREPISFIGAFHSARQDAEGEARIVFVVPASELASIARLVLDGRKVPLKITVEEENAF